MGFMFSRNLADGIKIPSGLGGKSAALPNNLIFGGLAKALPTLPWSPGNT
jgi:hypothetical protein